MRYRRQWNFTPFVIKIQELQVRTKRALKLLRMAVFMPETLKSSSVKTGRTKVDDLI